MTQAQATALAAPIVELFNEMEDVLLKKIAKQLGRDGDLSDASKWRMRQLARAGLLDKEAVKTIRSYTGIQSDMLDIIIETAALHEIDHLDSAVRAADAAALSGVGIPPAEDTAYNAMKAFRRQAQQDINAVNTVMRYKTKQAFVTAVNEAFWDAQKSQRVYNALGMGTAEVITGAESLQTGIRDAISKLSEKGIPAFIDKAGREWSPEAYVRMDIRSTVGNTARQAQWDRCLEHGINLIEVDAHSGARPLCAPYQGRLYSLDGSSGTVKDGSGNEYSYEPLTSTSYGQAAGLFGINCGHHNYPFKAGINFKRYYPLETEEALAENSKQYAQSQKQRYYERQIRKAKEDCMMQDAAKNEEGFVKASQKLARRKEAYSDYCKSAGLRKDNKRTQVYGFDKSISSKATWANKKAKLTAEKGLTKTAASATIKNGKSNSNELVIKPNSVQTTNNGSSAFTKEAKKQLYDFEKSKVGRKTEQALILDGEGKEILRKDIGQDDKVIFTKDEMSRMSGAVISHNHNNGTTVSPEDIQMVIQTGASEIRASNSQGAYVFRLPQSKYTPKKIETVKKRISEYENEYVDNNRMRFLNGEISLQEYDYSCQQYAVEKFAKKYKADYFFEEYE